MQASATGQSPQEHMERLTGLPFACVGPDEDGSSQGKRKFWMVRPKENPHDAGRKITLALAEAGLTVLTFSPSRTAAERMIARSGRDNKDSEPPFVRVYRAGLTASEREEIEAADFATGRFGQYSQQVPWNSESTSERLTWWCASACRQR